MHKSALVEERNRVTDSGRLFSRILRALQPSCEPYHVHHREHQAEAILATETGGYPATILYEPQFNLVSVVVELGTVPLPVNPRLYTLPHAYAGGRLATVTIDGEDGAGWLRAASFICPSCQEAGPIMHHLIGDLKRLCVRRTWR